MRKRSVLLLGLISTAVFAMTAHAQYKWVDANGRIGYGDLPPADNVKILQAPAGVSRPSAASQIASSANDLPRELRNVVRSAPVVLYTRSNCEPCDLARTHLRKRGIPFTEKVVATRRDVAAYRDLGFPEGTGVPTMTAGSAQQFGYHAVRWDEALTQIGYPRQSVLPSGYQMPAAESLVADARGDSVTAGLPPRNNVLTQRRASPSSGQAPEASLRF
ncbi:MAG: glutaredoxin family protein [Burkholderiaceae bacterium]